MHESEHAVRLQADETDGEDGRQVGLPTTLILERRQCHLLVSRTHGKCPTNLQLLDRLLETLPGEKRAPAPQLAVSDPAEAADDEPPGHHGQRHDGEHPVQQPPQPHPPRASLKQGRRLRIPVLTRPLIAVTFFRRVLFGILTLITVVLTISPRSSDKLASRCF